MRVSTIDERFADFLDHPTLTRWLGVREELISRSDFDPYDAAWQQLDIAFADEDFAEVLRLADPLSRNGCLSPRYHFLVGLSALETGQASRAAWHRDCSSACLRAILDSGHGTEDDPYLTTYPSDCYDVLRIMNTDPFGQQLVDRDGSWCDVLMSTDGEEYWFDVTHLLNRDGRQRVHAHLQPSHSVASRPF